MFKRYFRKLKLKNLAQQFRKPSGTTGRKIGIVMNEGNEVLYDFTFSAMHLQENESILEIGFGNGKFFPKLFSKAGNLEVSGIDFSETMIAEARENNIASIGHGKLKLVHGNSNLLPFADNSFDKVFCINVLYFWDEPLPHLLEINRVLKPGGKFYATIRSKSSLELIPFAQYGFAKYTEEEWKEIIKKTPLRFLQTEIVDEPSLIFDNKNLEIYSMCLIAEKK